MAAIHGTAEKVVARVPVKSEGLVSVRRRHLAETRIVRGKDAPIALDLRFKGGEAHIEGREALRIAGILMPHINRYGGKRQAIESAVTVLEKSGGPEGYFERLARYAPADTDVPALSGIQRAARWPRHGARGVAGRKPQTGSSGAFTTGLFGLRPVDRLAVEMALHEEVEMRALRGQLADLERHWREAEEIAAIADDLLVPSSVRRALDRLRGA
jgi:hypothetical protein